MTRILIYFMDIDITKLIDYLPNRLKSLVALLLIVVVTITPFLVCNQSSKKNPCDRYTFTGNVNIINSNINYQLIKIRINDDINREYSVAQNGSFNFTTSAKDIAHLKIDTYYKNSYIAAIPYDKSADKQDDDNCKIILQSHPDITDNTNPIPINKKKSINGAQIISKSSLPKKISKSKVEISKTENIRLVFNETEKGGSLVINDILIGTIPKSGYYNIDVSINSSTKVKVIRTDNSTCGDTFIYSQNPTNPKGICAN